MRRLSYRPQRTILRPAEVRGIGFLTGADVCLRFSPAPPSSGVVFVRADLPGTPRLPAHVSQVSGTARRTTLGRGAVQVSLVEHVLAALAGLRLDNCLVELDASEPPGLDGSADGFVRALLTAGVQSQSARRGVWGVETPLTVAAGNATLTLHPPAESDPLGLTMSYFLDYGRFSPILRQVHTQPLTPGAFVRGLAGCRTFVLEEEAESLRRQGIGSRTTASDLLVFGPRGPISNSLRFANEPARHKVLDVVGDLALLGADLCGHVIACRSGHPLNVALARELHGRLVTTLSRSAAAA